MKLEVKSLSFAYGKRPILKNISFFSEGGEAIALLGPNGVGKSTFFKCLLGFLKPQEGTIEIDGKDIAHMGRKELSSLVAYIPQNSRSVYNHTVLDSVAMGLTSRMGLFSVPGEKEKEKAREALERMGIAHLEKRGCLNVSGGERQLMLIARALVQDARILIMDEPTANLDYGNAYRVMKMVEGLVKEGYTIIFSTHDPDAALRYADRILAFNKGEVIRDGNTSDALTPDVLSTLYSINVAIRSVSVRDKEFKVCIPTGHDTTPSAGCVVFDGDKVLLVRFSKRIGFPKGHQENIETLEETALRETKEETGIEAEIVDPRPFVVPSVRPGDQRSVFFYRAEYRGGTLSTQDDETDDAFWVDRNEVESLLSFDSDRAMYKEMMASL